MQKYEYLFVESAKISENLRVSRLHELLNELGDKGWELVASPKISNNAELDFIFKRPKG